MYGTEVPCEASARVLAAHDVIGTWKFGDPKIRCWRGRTLWESERVLSGNGGAKQRQGGAEPRLSPGCHHTFQSPSEEVSLFWCICWAHWTSLRRQAQNTILLMVNECVSRFTLLPVFKIFAAITENLKGHQRWIYGTPGKSTVSCFNSFFIITCFLSHWMMFY